MMAETKQITFTHKEVVEALIKHAGFHEGRWALHVRFGLAASNIGPSEEAMNPAAVVPILELGLSKTDKITNLSVDAAEVNPSAGGQKRLAQIRGVKKGSS